MNWSAKLIKVDGQLCEDVEFVARIFKVGSGSKFGTDIVFVGGHEFKIAGVV